MTAQTTTATTYADPCPGCDQPEHVYWVTSSPDTDTWACRHCGMQWVITVAAGTRLT